MAAELQGEGRRGTAGGAHGRGEVLLVPRAVGDLRACRHDNSN